MYNTSTQLNVWFVLKTEKNISTFSPPSKYNTVSMGTTTCTDVGFFIEVRTQEEGGGRREREKYKFIVVKYLVYTTIIL